MEHYELIEQIDTLVSRANLFLAAVNSLKNAELGEASRRAALSSNNMEQALFWLESAKDYLGDSQ